MQSNKRSRNGKLNTTDKVLLSSALTRIERIISETLGYLAAYGVLVLIWFTFICVVMRYIFNYPLEFGEEIGGYILAFVVFIGLAYSLRAGAHVRTQVVTGHLPPCLRHRLTIPIYVVELLFSTPLAYSTWRLVIKDYTHSIKSFYTLHTPMWIPETIVAIGATAFVIQMTIQLFRREEIR